MRSFNRVHSCFSPQSATESHSSCPQPMQLPSHWHLQNRILLPQYPTITNDPNRSFKFHKPPANRRFRASKPFFSPSPVFLYNKTIPRLKVASGIRFCPPATYKCGLLYREQAVTTEMASRFLLLVVLAALLGLVAAAPATVYFNPYPDTYGPVRKTMVVSQFPSRASSRPYTPIFEDGQEPRGRQQEEFDEDDDEQFDGPDGPEGLQFLWWPTDYRSSVT